MRSLILILLVYLASCPDPVVDDDGCPDTPTQTPEDTPIADVGELPEGDLVLRTDVVYQLEGGSVVSPRAEIRCYSGGCVGILVVANLDDECEVYADISLVWGTPCGSPAYSVYSAIVLSGDCVDDGWLDYWGSGIWLWDGDDVSHSPDCGVASFVLFETVLWDQEEAGG